MCDVVEHSDSRFSRIMDSLGRGGSGRVERKEVSRRNGSEIIRKGRERRRGERQTMPFHRDGYYHGLK